MKILSKAKIKGIGACVPSTIVTNDDLSKIVDTNDEWITTRTGIKERRKASPDQGSLDLAYGAATSLQEQGYILDDVDLVIVATITPDYYTPSISAGVQGKLGLNQQTMVMDINAACAGFVQALQIANGLITTGQNKKALIIGVETLSKIVDYSDRTTCVLFGDGAGAVLMEASDQPGLHSVHYGADGKSGDKLYCSNLSTQINGTEIPDEKQSKLVQDGRAVYNFVVKTVPSSLHKLFETSEYTLEDMSWFVPHSANLRMIHSIAEKIGISKDQVLESITNYGNTSAATIPLALWEAKQNGKLKSGDLIASYGFGGGLNHAGALFHWYK